MFAIVDEIVTRLLDHRCFTSGELKFFTQQFEETRNNYEPKQVDQIEKCIKDLCENDLPMAKDKLEKSNLFKIEPNIDDLLEQSKELIDMELKEEKRRNRKLAEIIIKYEAEKSLVIKETQTKIADLDTIYADKANDLKKYYKELEAKWRLDKVQ